MLRQKKHCFQQIQSYEKWIYCIYQKCYVIIWCPDLFMPCVIILFSLLIGYQLWFIDIAIQWLVKRNGYSNRSICCFFLCEFWLTHINIRRLVIFHPGIGLRILFYFFFILKWDYVYTLKFKCVFYFQFQMYPPHMNYYNFFYVTSFYKHI